MAVLNPFDFFLHRTPRSFRCQYDAGEKRDLVPYLVKPAGDAAPGEVPAEVPRDPVRTIDFLVALNRRLAADIRYLIRMEPGVQTPEETPAEASGSCRDSAGCWSRCCGISGLRRASCPAT
jgi:hypothetical protein